MKPVLNSIIYSITKKDWKTSVYELLISADLSENLKDHQTILIKPNLVSKDPPPITTPVELVEAIIDFIQEKFPSKNIIIGEGTAMPNDSTFEVFKALGYNLLSTKKGVTLVDLNEADLIHLKNSTLKRLPEIYLPKIAFECFLISVPVLKAHSLSKVTLTMKNMLGFPPPKHYQKGGSWKKSSFHENIEEAIFDLNCYRKPDFSILDATIGMKDAHLWGDTLKPHPNKIIASYDPVALDAFGALVLKKKWDDIGHIRMADGILGNVSNTSLQEI